ncbi:hypothetical protein STEG23_002596, partial [Scotinomys teguina]
MAEGTHVLLEVLDPETGFLREKIAIPKRSPSYESKHVCVHTVGVVKSFPK